MNNLIVNQPLIKVKFYLTKAGVAVTGEAKPVILCSRYGDTSRETILAGDITWTEIGGGAYEASIADDGGTIGGSDDMICRYAGQLMFMIDADTNFDLVNRTFEVVIPDEIFLDDSGSDVTGDGSRGKPYSLIDRAINSLMGWNGATYDRTADCIIHILDTYTGKGAAVNPTGVTVHLRGEDGSYSNFVTGGTPDVLTLGSVKNIHFRMLHSIANFLTVSKLSNVTFLRAAGSPTGALIKNTSNIAVVWEDLSFVNLGTSLTDIIQSGMEALTINNITFSNCGATQFITANSTLKDIFINNLQALWSNVASYIIKVNSTSKIILTNAVTDELEAGFKTGTGSYERFGVWEKDNINIALNSLITIDNNIDTLITGVTTSALTQSALAAITTIDTVVDAIKVNTDTIPAVLTRAQYVDFMNREVTDRNGAEPTEVKIGTGGNQKTVDVTYETIGSVSKVKQEVAS